MQTVLETQAAAHAARAAAARQAALQAAAKPAGAKPLPDFAAEADKHRHVTEFVKDNPEFSRFVRVKNGMAAQTSDATNSRTLADLETRAKTLATERTGVLQDTFGDVTLNSAVSTGLIGGSISALAALVIGGTSVPILPIGIGAGIVTAIFHGTWVTEARKGDGVLGGIIGTLGSLATVAGTAYFVPGSENFLSGALAWGGAWLGGIALSAALPAGFQVIANLFTRRAEKREAESLQEDIAMLQESLASPETVTRFFQEHPEQLKDFIGGYFARQIAEEKGKIEAEIARLESEAEQLRRDRESPALQKIDVAARKQILSDNAERLAEIAAAQKRLRDEAVAPLTRILEQIPSLVADVEGWIQDRKGLDEVSEIAARARSGKGTSQNVDTLLLGMRARLATLIGSVADAVNDAAFAHAAYVEVEQTALKA